MLAAKVDDGIRRRVLLQEAAERFRFDEDTLAREALRLRGDAVPKATPGKVVAVPGAPDPLGRAFLGLLLADAGLAGEGAVVEESALREEPLRRIYLRWCELRAGGEGRPGNRLLEDPETRSLVSELLTVEEPAEAFPEIVSRLRARVRAERARSLREAIAAAESHGDRAQVDRLLRELHALKDAS